MYWEEVWNSENLIHKRKFWGIFSVSFFLSSSRPHSLCTNPACSMLAGVFLCKRPILWDGRMAMEAFDGQHTKAKRQALIPRSVPQLPLWLHNTASGIALHFLWPWREKFTDFYTLNPWAYSLQTHALYMQELKDTVFMCTHVLIHSYYQKHTCLHIFAHKQVLTYQLVSCGQVKCATNIQWCHYNSLFSHHQQWEPHSMCCPIESPLFFNPLESLEVPVCPKSHDWFEMR